MRFFTTEGPVNCADHYCLPPLSRLDMEDVLALIAQKKYFLLHAPRQTGKTTCLLALADYLNAQGEYHAVYANIETAQAAREDVALGMADVTWKIALAASEQLRDGEAEGMAQGVIDSIPATSMIETFFSRWCEQLDKPLVLLLDEVDALVGDTLISLLRQLRAGYPKRPGQFPQTVMLCGVRDIRDYRMESAAGRPSSVVYNINAKLIHLDNFTQNNVSELLGQYTAECGQAFTPEAADLIWHLTGGQPWLVNALAQGAIRLQAQRAEHGQPIPPAAVEAASEELLAPPGTHLLNVLDSLQQPGVRELVEAVLSGDLAPAQVTAGDVTIAREVGLLSSSGPLQIANPIYAVLLRPLLT